MSHEQPDPRFDPRFQRGYRGTGGDSAAHRLGSPPMQPSRPAAEAQPDLAGPTATAAAPSQEPPFADDGATWPRRNPFVIAIFVASAVLVAVGAALIWQQAMTPYDQAFATETEALFQDVVSLLPPGLLTGGLVGIALGGATLAVLGRRRG